MRYPTILAAAAAVVGTATVFTVPASATPTIAVKYADLDLSSKAGQSKLERRIDSAARVACGMDEIRTGRFTPATAQRQCYEETKTRVHNRVATIIANEKSEG